MENPTSRKEIVGEVTESKYDEENEVIEYVMEFDDGSEIRAKQPPRIKPGTFLSEDAMRECAEKLPGTPVSAKPEHLARGHLEEYSIAPSFAIAPSLDSE